MDFKVLESCALVLNRFLTRRGEGTKDTKKSICGDSLHGFGGYIQAAGDTKSLWQSGTPAIKGPRLDHER
jgi:hypothetical protein